jgi:PAS domain S-box-containing protein
MAVPLEPADVGIGRLFWVIREAVIVGSVETGRIVLWNPAAEKLFGYSAAEAVGLSLEALVPERLRSRHRVGLRAYGRTGHGPLIDRALPIEVPALRKDGAEIVVELTLNPLEDVAGGDRYVLAILREVTERASLLETLREQANLLQLVPDAILVREPGSGTILYWNRGAEQTYGWREDEALGQPAHVLLQTQFPRPLAEIEAELERAGRWEGEIQQTARDGRQLSVASRWAVQQDPGGRPLVHLEVNTDVTARRQAEAEQQLLLAEQAVLRQREDLLATLSHDLKNPLASISATTQLLQRGLGSATFDAATASTGLERIRRATARMDRLLGMLLDAARLERGQDLELVQRPTDLVALIRRVAADQPPQEQQRIRIEARAPELTGEWDPARLEQVVDNLLRNALKYSPRGGLVTVSLGDEEHGAARWAVLRVHDRGVGIPAADLPHIFERFRRGGNVIGQIEGTGLGLAGAAHIVRQHGGTIAAESEEGSGATFTVRLPLPRSAATLEGA